MGLNQHLDLSQKQQLHPMLLQRIKMLSFNQDELKEFLNAKILENPFIDMSIPFNGTEQQNIDQDLSWIPDTKISLRDHLIEQVFMTYRDNMIREMIFFWINQLDQKGYVKKTLEEASQETQIEETVLLDALVLLQQLEPAGVAARSLQECLMLQTERDDTAPRTAYIILEDSFDAFVQHKWKEISRKYDISLVEVQAVADYIKKLDPLPGQQFQPVVDLSIRPDLIVTLANEELVIKEAKQYTPILTFDTEYILELKSHQDKEVTSYVEKKQQEYKSLQSNLQQRQETILRVGTAIIRKQKAFFFDQQNSLVPLQLSELAAELDLHESTISRAINGKYIQTDSGIYEFKFFLSRKLAQEDDSDISTHSIQQKILQLVEKEDKQKPLSDQKIVDLLQAEKIELSRRTVAKYRQQLNIPSSSKRKRFE